MIRWMNFSLSVLFVTCWLSFSFAETTPLSSKISSVTVYPSEALITRTAEAEAAAGAGVLAIEKLPVGLNDHSLRVELKGPEGIVFFGYEVRMAFEREAADEEIKKFEKRFEEIMDQFEVLKNQKQTAESANKFLDSVHAATADQLGQALVTQVPVTSEVTTVHDFIKQKQNENFGEIVTLRQKARELKKEKEMVEKELNRLRSQNTADTKTVEVRYETHSPGKLTVTVSYLMYGAMWDPVYNIRTIEGLEKCEISYLGNVTQTTGEDWNDVEVTLSTAKPELGASMPPLAPWYVRKQAPVIVYKESALADKRLAPMAMMADQMAFGGANAYEYESKPAIPLESILGEYDTHVTYRIPERTSIPSSNEPHQLPIAVKIFSVKPEYVTTPRLMSSVFIRAKIKNDSDFVFLPGQAFIFRGNDFIGEGFVPETQSGEEIKDLFLGVDERIKVEFHTLREFSNDNVLLGTQMAKERKYKIVLKSMLEKPATIEVWDQSPVSQDQDIKVERFDVSPEPSADLKDEEKSQGFIKWLLPVEPSKEASILFGFRVKYGKGIVIEGI